MPLHSNLLVSLIAALVAACCGGLLAASLRLPLITGYLLAGVAIGPFTPGFTADPAVAGQLADLGIVLLMFGVGMHFSLSDLLRVRAVAVPGALAQIAITTMLGWLLTRWWGWPAGGGLVFGLALSIASTVVVLRTLSERGLLDSVHGHIATGWLIVEDLFTVVVLVLLPAVSGLLGGSAPDQGSAATALLLALVKAAAFALLMLYAGTRLAPWLVTLAARSGSRELFTLSVLALALGVAGAAAALFGVSLALGAFLAGIVLAESDLSYQAAAETTPFRDAFAVVFFVSVGMLFDPAVLIEAPLHVVAVLALILGAKATGAVLTVLVLGQPARTAVTLGLSIAQVGEFSFILTGVGVSLTLLPAEARNLVLAGALASITLNAALLRMATPLEAWLTRSPLNTLARRPLSVLPAGSLPNLRGHAVICGYGRVGSIIGRALERRGIRLLVIDLNVRVVEHLRERGIPAVYGDAGHATILAHAGLAAARVVIVTVPDRPATRRIVQAARAANPQAPVIVRTHSAAERRELRDLGVTEAVLGELELALEMTRAGLRRFGVTGYEAQAVLTGIRQSEDSVEQLRYGAD